MNPWKIAAAILLATMLAAPAAASASTTANLEMQTLTLLQQLVDLQQQLIAALQTEVAQLQSQLNPSTESSSQVPSPTAPNSNDQSFGASPSSGSTPLAVTFTASGYDTPQNDSDYVVDFGDGNKSKATASGSNYTASHTYQSSGSYTATLYVETNLCGGLQSYGCVSDLQVGSTSVAVNPIDNGPAGSSLPFPTNTTTSSNRACVADHTTYANGVSLYWCMEPSAGQQGCPAGLIFSWWTCSNGRWIRASSR